MVRIEQVEVVIADIPTIRPHVLAMATMHSQAVVLVFLRRSDGIVGVGEATTIGGLAYGDESPESIKINIETYFAPILKSCDADDAASSMALLSRHIVGNRFAKCAVETALLDGLGQARGLPVSELLGGRRVDRLEVAWTLASGDTATDIEEGERVLEARRHRHFKLKIGKRDVAADCAHVGAIARAFEGRASVRVDVNQAWTRHQAEQGAALLQDSGVVLIEQPLAKADFEGMAELADRHEIAIMADEALTGPDSARQLAKARAGDAFSLKITQSGGLVPTLEVAAIAEAAKIALYGGTMLEGGIGTAASAHVFACLPDLVWYTELFGPLLMVEEFLTEPLIYQDFGLIVPQGPGLGVSVDRSKLDRFRRH
ncbi:muconate/chloromuconate family cycloisomerase [Novosphingobium sp. B 225]|uniref:muconate/chloromuconate family cycloisomerase n=1 Tax=Novosphingobium sp. B 225 TaxID=1961849 RepID=UPI000B4A8346|nr:muconate/chloromuconate family cycloisomerase [Novosphingobium sp. B 225]